MNLLEKIRSGVYLIAEMSANHNGDLSRAIEIVRAAKAAGADCLKIQTYTADAITIDCGNEPFIIKGGLWDGYKLYDLYKKAATPYEWQEHIKNECGSVGIDFLSTPFDREGADFLERLGAEAYKVASFELVDIPLLRHIAKKGKPMVVSCGMGSQDEIAEAVEAMLSEGLPKERIVLLKCTSDYPAEPEDMNLATIPDMAERFGAAVGLSDHSLGSFAPVAAVALGARVVEKHFCLSRAMGGVDSAFSMEPHEFREMAESVHKAFAARGSARYGAVGNEKSGLAFRRSVFAVRGIAAGERFTEENIRVIRPAGGVAPKHYDRLVGQPSARAYSAGTPIAQSELANW